MVKNFHQGSPKKKIEKKIIFKKNVSKLDALTVTHKN
jgi:hypothetical protein